MKRVARWLGWWLALFWLWLLLAGEWNQQEWIAAAAAAAIGASLGELAWGRAGASFAPSRESLLAAPSALGMVFVDFAILVRALLRREVVRGEFREREVKADRAWIAYLASISPNAYVIEIDPKSHRALLHDLVPFEPSEKPAA